MSDHTPGPWTISDGRVIYGNRGMIRPFVVLVDDDHNDAETDANTYLIAASPDLYAALRDLIQYLGTDVDNGLDELLTNARAAIAKAKGDAT